MTSSRRLSLRARMLILLIAVTAIFLLIMGAVTTAVLSKRVSNVFTADLIAEATRSPAKLADNTDVWPRQSRCAPARSCRSHPGSRQPRSGPP